MKLIFLTNIIILLIVLISIIACCYFYKIKINSLSKSIEAIEKEFKPFITQMHVMSTDIMPTPNMVKLIEETIKEHLTIELILTGNNKTKFGKAMIVKVTENTQNTYPYINSRYISEKVVSMFEHIAEDETKRRKDDE